MADGGDVVTQKVGGLPLVLWVAGGAGVIGIFILMTHKGNNGASANQTNSVNALAPTEAEAFGTIEQQQQDVTNALTTLGNNQSALGGSLSTLTGIVTQQGSDNAAAFQNLVNGQNTIEQGQSSASDQATNYYNALLQNLTNYYNSLGTQINGVNSNVTAQAQAQQGLMSALQTAINNLTGQVGTNQQQAQQWYQSLQQQIQSGQQLSTSQMNQIGSFLGWQFYQIPNRYTAYIPQGLNPPGWS